MNLLSSVCLSAFWAVWPALFGLDPGYYAHLVAGQARLLLNRKPIKRLLERTDLDPQLRARLEFVQDIRRFAVDRIGLSDSHSYASYSPTGDGPFSWQLTVAHADRLEPVTFNYPVVGRFPYKGFFDAKRARKESEKWRRKGYDTHLRPVSAYSTLGWFDDPVITPMLRYADVDLANLIIHELTHETVWISDDVGFNESLATFVGQAGSIEYLEHRYGAGSARVIRAHDLRHDGEVFRSFMFSVADDLRALYSLPVSREEKLSRRQAVFDSARSRFRNLPLRTEAYGGFERSELNNARFVSYRTYHERTDVFDRVRAALGGNLRLTVELLKTCEEARDPASYLEGWLATRGSPSPAGSR